MCINYLNGYSANKDMQYVDAIIELCITTQVIFSVSREFLTAISF